MAKLNGDDYLSVICIGAGFSGICFGAQLQRQLKHHDFHIYDMFDDFGGTWCTNSYPGAACDVPAAFYSFSFAQSTHWSTALAPRSELFSYLTKVAETYGLRERTTFRTRCEQTIWDSARSRWIVHLVNIDSGAQFKRECSVLITGVGAFSQPNAPSSIADFSKFEGSIFHSARWNHDIDLNGKDVVLVGNGCSANQIVPAIAPRVRSLTQIVRSAQWVLPPVLLKYTPRMRWTLQNVPLAQQLLRWFIFIYTEVTFIGFFMSAWGKHMRNFFENKSKDYIASEAPKEYQSILVPKFEMGCKRRIFDQGYIPSLRLPNVSLARAYIVEVLPRSIRTTEGTYPADVVVLATGFVGNRGYQPFRIVGRDGLSLREHWGGEPEEGLKRVNPPLGNLAGPGAYNSIACAGFPNFFFLLGPNSGTGHTSAVLAIENMTNLVIKLITPILRGEQKAVEIRAEAEQTYVARIQHHLRGMVWSQCHSWYKTDDDGWNANLYPWSQVVFWWRCTFPTWRDWVYTPAEKA
ncbi:putative monooxygenase [Auriculariales sp. MPI-PUGE-AT-0066]|nr:putative monooxygenase [Auriculariales sp. MPI-PUGE-AT-0066]